MMHTDYILQQQYSSPERTMNSIGNVMFNKRAGLFYRGRPNKIQPASLWNSFKNVLQKACLLGVQTKVQIVRGRY